MDHDQMHEFIAISHRADPLQVSSHRLAPPTSGGAEATLLCAIARRRDSDQNARQVHDLIAGRQAAGLSELLPTFAAVTRPADDEVIAAADVLGFRHMYYGQTADAAALSTSAHLVAERLGSTFDQEALAVQSQVGWQLGQRTLYSAVRKLSPGAMLTLSGGQAHEERFTIDSEKPRIHLQAAVDDAAATLRVYLSAFLDDHPDAILQLSGGLDSRILLSAIPSARRRGLRVVTLGAAGNPDLDIATDLVRRFGMQHEIISIAGLEDLEDAEAYRRCVDAATRLDCSSDPLAHASLAFAEARAEDGPRLSGLGGEVARGFYYHGRDSDAPVTRQRADRLADWRLFTNESVEPEALNAEFGPWARDFARADVHRILAGTGKPWFSATDDLYLAHRMQRWGGITDTAVCMDRRVVNPMLDDRFLAIARRLAPGDKRNTRFLSRLLLALDADLASIPLDGRPAPLVYAQPSLRSSARLLTSDLTKFSRKAVQRIRRANRPPVGGAVLAAKVVAHWRTHPALLEPLDDVGILDPAWLGGILDSTVTPRSSSVAFLLNILVAEQLGRTSATHA